MLMIVDNYAFSASLFSILNALNLVLFCCDKENSIVMHVCV